MGLTRAQAESLGIGHLYPIENDADVLCRLGSGPIDRLAGRIPSKYNAVRTQYTGVWYASKAEAKRAAHLDAMVTGGTVRFWMRQVKFRLGLPENVYIVDFVVVPRDGQLGTGIVRAEDVKGHMTDKFKRDIKLWRAYGPCPLWLIMGGKIEVVEGKS